MPNPAFIVEGHQEQMIIRELCPGQPVQKLGVNGKYVSYEKIASVIDIKMTSIGNSYYPFVVLFDRENRNDSSDEIIESICNKLEKFRSRDFVASMIFGVPDRKIESWLLPFIDNYGNFTDSPIGEYEGKNCLGELRNRFSGRVNKYKKTEQGVSYFTQIKPRELAKVSPSFKKFYDSVTEIPCRWLQNI